MTERAKALIYTLLKTARIYKSFSVNVHKSFDHVKWLTGRLRSRN